MEELEKSKVYIQIDEKSRILRCEGGFSISNIKNIDEWILIDEGFGDKYNLCQSHYFDGGLYTEDGICRYKYEDGSTALRSEDEIQEDRESIPVPAPSGEAVSWDKMAEAIREGVNDV